MIGVQCTYIDLHVCTHVPCFRLVLVVLSQYWLSHIFVLTIGCESKRTTRRGVENSGKGKCTTKTDHWWIRNVAFASMEREQFTKKDLVALDCDIHVQKWNKSVISCVKSLQITCTVHCLLRKKIPLVLWKWLYILGIQNYMCEHVQMYMMTTFICCSESTSLFHWGLLYIVLIL